MKIISQRHREEYVEYCRSFERDELPGSGFSFDSDEHGNVDVEKLKAEKPIAFKAYQECLAGVVDGKKIHDRGVVKYKHTYINPAVGKCECGRHVALIGFTNACDCGRDYNMSGSLLAAREQWGEETGESLSDILRIK